MASPYLAVATDGTDLGANMATITALTSVASSGDRRSVTETRYSAGWYAYNSVNRVQYPRTLLNTDTFPTRTGALRNVSGDAQFLAAINAAQPGDWIIVDHTVVYTGNYFGAFPVKNGDTQPGGNNVIVVMSKAIYDSIDVMTGLPTVCPPKKRLSATDLPYLAEFRCTNTLGAFKVNGPTNGWRFVGLNFSVASTVGSVSHLACLGDPDGAIQQNASQCPSNLGFDRCYFNGHASSEIRHTCELHCKYGYVIDSLWGDNNFVINYSDCQPITMYNGPGPFRVVNNQLTGGVENVIIGGSNSPCGMPADMEFRFNYMTRPLSWYGTSKKVKCCFEIKKAQYVLVEGNIIENVWPAGQVGMGFLIKSESYGDGATIGYTQDILLRSNIVRNVSAGVTMAGVPNVDAAYPVNRVFSVNNLYQIGGTSGGVTFTASANPMIGLYYCTNSGTIHDTFVSEGTVNAIAQPDGSTGFVMLDTIFGPTNVGLKGGSVFEGQPTITAYMSGATVSKNVFTGRTNGGNTPYPAGNYFPADVATIQFTNAAAKDYSLSGTTQTGGGTVVPVATSLRLVTPPSGGQSGNALTTQPAVEILDQFGNRFNSTATITATSDSGAVTETGNTKAAVAGLATFTALTPSAASTVSTTWTFTSPGLTSVTSASVSITVPVASPVATALRVVTQPSGAISGRTFTTQPVVEVLDQYGTRIASTAPITATLSAAVAVSRIGTATVNAVAGVATWTDLGMSATAETSASIVFSSPGLTSVTSNAFVCTLFVAPDPNPTPSDPPPTEPPTAPDAHPVPAQLVFTREPGPVGKLYSRKKWPQQPIVEARTASGTLMTTFNGQMTLYTTTPTVTLRGTLTITAVGGIGRWTNVSALSTDGGPMDLFVVDGPRPTT